MMPPSRSRYALAATALAAVAAVSSAFSVNGKRC